MNKFITLMIVGFLLVSCFVIISDESEGYEVFTNTQYISVVDVAPLTDESYIVGFMNNTTSSVCFKIMSIYGETLVGTTIVDTNTGQMHMTGVSVCALSSTLFVIAWLDSSEGDMSFAFYNNLGAKQGSTIDVDTAVSWHSYSVSLSAFNSTRFVIAWFDEVDADASFAIYSSSGTVIKSETDVDTDVSTSGYAVSVSCFNSTRFVIGWYDKTDADMTFAIYDSSGTIIGSPVDVDTDVGIASYAVTVSCLSSTKFVFAFTDYTDKDTTFAVYSSTGSQLVAPIDIDTDSSETPSSYMVMTTAISADKFAISWFDIVDVQTKFAIYWANGTLISSSIIFDDSNINNDLRVNCPASYEASTGIGLKDGIVVFIYAVSNTETRITYFNSNGEEIDTEYSYLITDSTPELLYSYTNRYIGFSGACKLPNGDLLMLYRNSTQHLSVSGVTEQMRSEDGGVTWENEGIKLDYGDDIGVQTLIYFNNRLITFGSGSNLGGTGAHMYYSTNNGSTYNDGGLLYSITDDMPIGVTISQITQLEIVGDTLYGIGFYNSGSGFRTFIINTTDGINYQYVATVSDDDLNEASIIYLGNDTFYGVFRTDNVTYTYDGYSYDMGLTWSVQDATSKLNSIIWQDPQLEWIDENVLMLIGRDWSGYSLGYVLSSDNGSTWSNYQNIQDYRSNDQHHEGGYCNVIPNASDNGSALVVFYSNALPLPSDSYPGMWQTWLTGGSFYNVDENIIPPGDDDEPINYPGSYGIGLILIILACAIPFIGFIVKTLGKDD